MLRRVLAQTIGAAVSPAWQSASSTEGGEVAGAVAVTTAITENCGNSEPRQILTELDQASFCKSVLALLLVVLGIVLEVGGCALMGIRAIDRGPPEAAGPTTALAA